MLLCPIGDPLAVVAHVTGETLCAANNSCISSSDCCTDADCAAVSGATCPVAGQACQCSTGGDKACPSTKSCVPQDACCTAAGACCDDPLGKSCSAATVQAALTLGGSITAMGTLTAMGEEDWISVTFNNEANLAFHGHIVFSANPGTQFVFDVASSCGVLRACGEGGTCEGKTEWEEMYGTPTGDPTGLTWAPIPAVGLTYIRVYRSNPAAAPTCDQWELTISE